MSPDVELASDAAYDVLNDMVTFMFGREGMEPRIIDPATETEMFEATGTSSRIDPESVLMARNETKEGFGR